MSDALRLFGLKSIVTTAASGIGEAIVRTFVKHGASVLAVDTVQSGVDSHFRGLRSVHPLALDVNNPKSAAEMVEAAESQLNGLDIVVNYIDWSPEAPINDGDKDELDRLLMMMTNLISNVCKLSVPLLKKSPSGRIINVGCVRSVFGLDGDGAYSLSQAAIADLTAGLAAELGDYGVTANYIQPGAVMTPASRRAFGSDKNLRDHLIRRSAARRLGEPVDIAKVALFLATNDSAFVSGAGIVADGGNANYARG